MRILQVFNRYLQRGGEEKSVDRIANHLGQRHEVERCFFDSADWQGAGAPGRWGQLRRLFGNSFSRHCFDEACDRFQPDLALFHNVFPVGSPSLYRAAVERNLPLVHYVHCFRPFSVGGSLMAAGREYPGSLAGDLWPEALAGAWQGSRIKSLAMAAALIRLRRSGWLDQVRDWVCISDYLAHRFVHDVGLPPERVHSLRHSWDSLPEVPMAQDQGFYLFLGRLVEEKGLRTLLQAWSVMGDRAPRMVIAGEGPLLAELQEQGRRLGGAIEFVGHLDGERKDTALGHCRAVVVPSIWGEPLGLVPYEAYDHGKPVIASAIGGLTETVRHRETGLLVAPRNPESLGAAVQHMENQTAAQRFAWGAEGRRWLLQEADPGLWNARIDKILSAAVGD